MCARGRVWCGACSSAAGERRRVGVGGVQGPGWCHGRCMSRRAAGGAWREGRRWYDGDIAVRAGVRRCGASACRRGADLHVEHSDEIGGGGDVVPFGAGSEVVVVRQPRARPDGPPGVALNVGPRALRGRRRARHDLEGGACPGGRAAAHYHPRTSSGTSHGHARSRSGRATGEHAWQGSPRGAKSVSDFRSRALDSSESCSITAVQCGRHLRTGAARRRHLWRDVHPTRHRARAGAGSVWHRCAADAWRTGGGRRGHGPYVSGSGTNAVAPVSSTRAWRREGLGTCSSSSDLAPLRMQ